MRRFRAWFALPACALLLTGCTVLHPRESRSTASVTQMPQQPTEVLDGATAFALALQASRALFSHAPVVVIADADDIDDAVAAAHALRVPLLLTPQPSTAVDDAALVEEVRRLGATTEVTVGAGAAAWAGPGAGHLSLVRYHHGSQLPTVRPGAPLRGLVVLATDPGLSRAAATTADSAGADVLRLPGADPRADSATISALSTRDTSHVLALGAAFGPVDRLRERVATAATGVQLPGGGQVVFPGRTMVALYGSPGSTVLGALGEQPLAQALARARRQASAYRAAGGQPVVPTFEIIATVASATPGPDGSYSTALPVDALLPWVQAAARAGVYVVLDLQPGRTTFLSQATRYTKLLLQPNVGLGLDPEWRLKSYQVPMVQIGSVSAAEVNATSAWLDQLTRGHHLPQKVLVVHQFRLDMVTDMSTLVTDRDGVRIVIHADGFGTPSEKRATWDAITGNAPGGVYFGWKNFYDEDKPTFTPGQTMSNTPCPVFVSYQ